jgi:hypothetical protein
VKGVGVPSANSGQALRLRAARSAQDDGFGGEAGEVGFGEDGFGGDGFGGDGFFGGKVGDFDGAAWRGEVGVGFGDGAAGLLVDVADELGGSADDAQAAGVGGGELEAVEEGVRLLAVDVMAGERVEDAGDGELGGFAVLDGGELDGGVVIDAGGVEVHLVAVGGVAAVQAAVEVAELGAGELDAVALEAVGLDVSAEIDLHGGAPLGGTPPGGVVVLSVCGRAS